MIPFLHSSEWPTPAPCSCACLSTTSGSVLGASVGTREDLETAPLLVKEFTEIDAVATLTLSFLFKTWHTEPRRWCMFTRLLAIEGTMWTVIGLQV